MLCSGVWALVLACPRGFSSLWTFWRATEKHWRSFLWFGSWTIWERSLFLLESSRCFLLCGLLCNRCLFVCLFVQFLCMTWILNASSVGRREHWGVQNASAFITVQSNVKFEIGRCTNLYAESTWKIIQMLWLYLFYDLLSFQRTNDSFLQSIHFEENVVDLKRLWT